MVLGDGNANGRFGDWRSGEEPDLRDPLYLLPSVEEGDIIEPTFWGDRLLLDGILYRVSVNTPDRKLTLTILDEEMAQLVVPRELQYLSLLAEEGQLVTFAETDGMVEVPVGSYQLVQFTMVRVDAQGRRWHGHGGGDSRTPRIAATKDGPSELKFGGPYVPEVRVTDSSRNRWERGAASVWLQPYLRGQGGELLLTLSYEFPESGRAERPSEPSYAIYRPDGTIAAQGKFEYG